MWKNILGQAAYQVGILMVLLNFLPWITDVQHRSDEHYTVIFNTFVWCQVFNEINARKISGGTILFLFF
jgi:hypothetical protein